MTLSDVVLEDDLLVGLEERLIFLDGNLPQGWISDDLFREARTPPFIARRDISRHGRI
jgi:hypothetical protein